ncbi:uncharacterized protein [Spinacia oleracea]|uniref:RNase H type-1 domain-containing protein n=1 Tax=Spinacia oleracea TaxID=3562 RepID=A0ABM3RSV0_SPIOL|nr:uncharacterized protein LOC110784009 [Spinacia oleracea]
MTHLFFADDALLFFNATNESCCAVSNILQRFCGISGQQLNLQKSLFKVSPNTPEESRLRFKGILKMELVQNIGTHLGVPIDLVGKKHSNFHFIVDKVAVKISAWNSCNLSQSQKLVLINSVLLAMASHVFSCMEVPLSISSKLDSIITRFFWAGRAGSGFHWVNRRTLQIPRGLGGLGIRNASCLNKALLMRQVWRLNNNPLSLLAGVVDRKFLKPLRTGIKASLIGRRLSWGMRGLGRASNLVLEGCNWKVGNGKSIVAGRDKWVNGGTPVFSSNVTLRQAKDWKVHHFLLPSGEGWNLAEINSRFEFLDARRILSMELPSSNAEDFLYWKYHISGKLSVKSAYAMLVLGDSSDYGLNSESVFYKSLWSMKILPKWKMFFWKLLHNGIATKANLGRRGVQLSMVCDECNAGDEDLQHLFRFCKFAQDVWRSGSLAIHSNFNEAMSFQEWNNRVFRGQSTSSSAMHNCIKSGLDQISILHQHPSPYLRFFHPPEVDPIFPPGFSRIILSGSEDGNPTTIIVSDGSWFKSSKIAGMGWYLDRQQVPSDRILGGAQPGLTSSALHSEVLACLLSLRWASQAGFNRVTIFTDSLRLVDLLRSMEIADINLIWTLAEIQRIGKTFLWCCINKVDRQRVHQAHKLAKAASTLSSYSASLFEALNLNFMAYSKTLPSGEVMIMQASDPVTAAKPSTEICHVPRVPKLLPLSSGKHRFIIVADHLPLAWRWSEDFSGGSLPPQMPFSALPPHLNSLFPFSNYKKGRDFSADLLMNLVSAAIFPVNLWMSLTLLGFVKLLWVGIDSPFTN